MELSDLPNEVLQLIFSSLDHRSHLAVLEVCRKWNALASTAQFMDRIWLRLCFEETEFMSQLATLRENFHKYRHVVIDCGIMDTSDTIRTHHLVDLAEMFTADNNVETLALSGMENVTETDLLMLLQNVPKLRRLYLLEADVRNQNCFCELPFFTVPKPHSDDQWKNVFDSDSAIVLPNVYDVILTTQWGLTLRIESFLQSFPNITQLQITVDQPSIVTLIEAYKDQLEKLSMCSVTEDLSGAFYDITFTKLSHLYLDLKSVTLNTSDVTKCENFFKNPHFTKNLRELKVSSIHDSVLSTICSNCTSLQVLGVGTGYFDYLHEISNLSNLKKLSLDFQSRSFDFVNFEQYEHLWQPIPSLKSLKVMGPFDAAYELLWFFKTMAPSLEVLSLVEVGIPQETMRMVSETLPKIRHLTLSYWRQYEKPPRLNFGFLQNMHNLVSYSLRRIIIEDDRSIEKWIQKAPNLSKIKLAYSSTLSDAHLMDISLCCPKLRQLELKGRINITAEGLEEFRQNVPHVIVTEKFSDVV